MMTMEKFKDVAHRCLQGRQDALAFIFTVTDILHVWDDLIDRDKPVSPEAVHRAFTSALIRLPRDPFYIAHFGLLNPILEMAILNWHISNTYEAGDDEYEHHISYILRSSYSDLATMCARIVGGEAWARQVGPEIHRHWHGEGWAGYRASLAKEKEARQ